mmetsp:Transcript_12124/g.29601  ORF Transcript_12124/g.29601 Transcript_12124/m.29601 type:complete len:249 (+) Transcript_12124:766-1512(+)
MYRCNYQRLLRFDGFEVGHDGTIPPQEGSNHPRQFRGRVGPRGRDVMKVYRRSAIRCFSGKPAAIADVSPCSVFVLFVCRLQGCQVIKVHHLIIDQRKFTGVECDRAAIPPSIRGSPHHLVAPRFERGKYGIVRLDHIQLLEGEYVPLLSSSVIIGIIVIGFIDGRWTAKSFEGVQEQPPAFDGIECHLGVTFRQSAMGAGRQVRFCENVERGDVEFQWFSIGVTAAAANVVVSRIGVCCVLYIRLRI